MDCLKCLLCNNQFVEPRELKCLHVFCKECIERELLHSHTNVAICRLCSAETEIRDLQKSRVMELALEASALGHTDVQKDEETIHEVEGLANDLRHELLTITNSDSELQTKKMEIADKISKFYQNLIADLTNYLKEQSSDILNELETIFDGYEREHFIKNGTRERLAASTESVCKMFSDIYTTRDDRIMEDLKQETVKYFRRCRDMVCDVGSVRCDVKFLSGEEQRDLVLTTNFGALMSTNIADESNVHREHCNTYEERMENVLETSIPRHASIENPAENLLTDQLSHDVTDSVPETTTSHLVELESTPNSHSESLNQREGSQTESGGRGESEGIDLSAQSGESSPGLPAITNGAGVTADSTEDPPPGVLGSNDTDAYPQEQPPSYWEVVNETEAPSSASPTGPLYRGRGRPPQYSPRLSESFTSGVSSRPGQRNRIPHTNSFDLHNLNTVHASNPLQYATHARSIRTKLPDDARSGPIVGIAWLQDKLVLVDRFNSKIKMFTEAGEFLHSLKFVDGEPWDVCTVNVIETLNYPPTCAATIPRQKLIMIIQITGGRILLINHRIATRTGYACIAYDQKNGCIVCGVSSPFGTSGIDVINTAGVLLAQFPLPRQVLVRSIDVSIKDTIIICDWRKNNITFLSKTGTAIGHYSGSEQYPLQEPVGTCTDGRGFLFVADSKSNTIHILTAEGKLYGTVKSSCPIIRPKEINVRPDGPPMLAISHGSNFVEIFNLFESSEVNPTTIPSAPALPM